MMKKPFILSVMAVTAIAGFALQSFSPTLDALAFLPFGSNATGVSIFLPLVTAAIVVAFSLVDAWWSGLAKMCFDVGQSALAAVGKSFAQAKAAYDSFVKQAVDKVRKPYPLTSLRC